MKLRRRSLLVILAIVIVAGVVGFVAFREDSEEDLPRLVILEQWDMKAKKPVVFRLDAPKRRTAWLVSMSTQNPSTGRERKAMLQVAGDIHYEVVETGGQFQPHLGVAAGQSMRFGALPPLDDVWRLRCQVVLQEPSRVLTFRVKLGFCLQTRSLAPMRWKMSLGPETLVELDSEPITNAVPRTADAPAQ